MRNELCCPILLLAQFPQLLLGIVPKERAGMFEAEGTHFQHILAEWQGMRMGGKIAEGARFHLLQSRAHPAGV